MSTATKPANVALKSFDSEKIAASAIASPISASAIDALLVKSAADSLPADDTLIMTGEQISAGHEDALAQIVSTEDLVAAAVEDYAHTFASPVADEVVLLAQSGRNTDAGGGLVQQEEEQDDGGMGWGWALGALALGLAAGGGGGGGDTPPTTSIFNYSGSPGSAYLLDVNGTSFSVASIGLGGISNTTPVAFIPYAANLTVSLPGNPTYDTDSANLDALPNTFEVLRVSTTNGGLTYSESAGPDLLIIWNSEGWGNKDFGVVVKGAYGSSFTIDGYTLTWNGTGYFWNGSLVTLA